MAKHLHQPVISMGAGAYTFSSHLTWTGVWWRSCRKQGGLPSALGDFGGFTTKI